MPTVTIRNVVIGEKSFDISVEFDFALVDGGSAVTMLISISKSDYLFWQENNAGGSVLDYITDMVRPHYEALKKQRDLAQALNLINKTLAW